MGLQWNGFQSTVSNSFKIWRQEKSFFDVTLVADDHKQFQEQLDSFLDVACKLQIAGLESDHGKDMNNEFPANVKDQKNGEEAKEEYMETFEISKMNSENKPRKEAMQTTKSFE